MDLSLVYVYSFDEFIGRPIDELLLEVRKHYPFADLHFSGGGRVEFFTGLWLGRQPIMIRTVLYEGPGETLSSERRNGDNLRPDTA